MKIITCENMRRLMNVSVASLVAGILMFLIFLWFGGLTADEKNLSLFYLAMALILISPLVLLVNLVLGMMPGSRQILKQCNN